MKTKALACLAILCVGVMAYQKLAKLVRRDIDNRAVYKVRRLYALAAADACGRIERMVSAKVYREVFEALHAVIKDMDGD